MVRLKKLINSPQSEVRDGLAGLASAHADVLRVSYDPDFIVRIDAPVAGKVGILSGGGSGHEPLHGGYVGRGMLDAACPGPIFTSPVPDQIVAATHAINGSAGVLHIVKNYTGDVLNFEIAADLLQADGIEIATVLIDDDVAIDISATASDGAASVRRCWWKRSREPPRKKAGRWLRSNNSASRSGRPGVRWA